MRASCTGKDSAAMPTLVRHLRSRALWGGDAPAAGSVRLSLTAPAVKHSFVPPGQLYHSSKSDFEVTQATCLRIAKVLPICRQR